MTASSGPVVGRDRWAESQEVESRPELLRGISDFLLLKLDSHRVHVISHLEILPLQWRVEAHRTILPDELGLQFGKWKEFFNAVKGGAHRRYLDEVRYFLDSCRFLELVAIGKNSAEASLSNASSWAARPEVQSARCEILAFITPSCPPVPELVLEQHFDSGNQDRWQQLATERNHFVELVHRWNEAVGRKNWNIQFPRQIEGLESWIAMWLRDDGFERFSHWVKPWIHGGYGLYRDCD